MHSPLGEHFSVDAAVPKKADPKRASLQSGISEFSFEQSDETAIANNQNQPSTERNTSPIRPIGKIEQLVKKTGELEKRNTDQNTLISALRSHIHILEKRLRENGIEVPSFSEPTILKDTVIRSLNLEPVSKNVEKLHLPPRSADRLKTSPLRSPVSQRTAPSRSQEILSQLDESNEPETSSSVILQNKMLENTDDSEIDFNADYNRDDQAKPEQEHPTTDKEEDTQEPLSPKSEILNLHLEEMDTEPVQQTVISSPTPVKANVDWNATIEALKSSTNDGEEEGLTHVLEDNDYEDVAVETVETKIQMTPYSGRIASPSPYRNNRDALSPTGLQFSTLNTTPHVDRNAHLSPTQNGSTSPMDNRSLQPVSPIRLQALRTAPPSRAASQRSVPVSQASVRSPVNSENMPLSRANLYDPYTDFHQQPHNDYSQLNTPQSSNFPTSPQAVRAKDLLPPPPPTYPSDVPLFVDPSHLNTVKPEIISTIHGNPTKKSDDPYISIAILDRQSNKEMWRFKKSLSQILMLDADIRPVINSFSLPPVPEKSLFLTNAPVKVDSRRTRTKDYFATLFSIPDLPLNAAYKIARFMSLDVINLLDESNMDAMKEGWLLRRTKGLGSTWKARYCIIDGPFINVHESPDGPLIEIIKLTGSQIGRQPDDLKISDDKSTFRHAFAVLEPKKAIKSNSFAKHIFCAETDIERDLWVNVLVQLLEDSGSAQSIYSLESTTASSMTTPKRDHASPDTGITFSPSKTMSSSASVDLDDQEQQEKEAKRQKKRSFFPFSKKQMADDADQLKQHHDAATSLMASSIEKSLQEMNLGPVDINPSTVFQNELQTVLGLSSHEMFGVYVPSIIYRCLSYLIDRSAIYEEGLFRLSGSSAMIKQLRGSFDMSHDVDFNRLETRPDINTVAGLLKLWLRELPTNILTKELYSRFKDASDGIQDPAQRSQEFSRLAKGLPPANYAVLYVLFKFLNDVIKNKDANKMNLRNLCIVFSPTLNIASDIIVPFLVDFRCVFENGTPIGNEEREAVDLNIPTF